MRNLVVFKEIVPGMIVLLASFPALVSTAPPVSILGRNLMPANRSAALPIQTPIRFHTSGDEHRRIATMVQLVVDHPIMATLPGPEPRGMPGDLTEVVNGVVNDLVMVVDVFGAGSITCQEDSSLAQVSEFRIDDAIALGMQVHTQSRTTGSDKATVRDLTLFSPAESQQGGRSIEHIPVMLHSPAHTVFIACPGPAIRVGKSQSREGNASGRGIGWAIVIDCPLYPNQLGSRWRQDLTRRSIWGRIGRP